MVIENRCEICGGPNDMTVNFEYGRSNDPQINVTIPVIMCYRCFMKLMRAGGKE